MERERWIDIAKGLGIILVVEAHIDPSRFAVFVFLFHMPLFFMLSGYLMRRASLMSTVKSKAWALMVPYVCYLIGLGAPELVRAPWATVEMFFWGGRLLTGKLGVFWFVTVLFVAQLVFASLLAWRRRAFDPFLMAVVASLTLAGYWSAGLSLPWNAGVVPMALFFLWAGYALKDVGMSSGLLLVAMVTALSAIFVLPDLSERIGFDMKAGLFGYPIYGLALAVALSILLMAGAKGLARNRHLAAALTSIGAASLTIMFLHQSVHLLAAHLGLGLVLQFALALLLPYCAHQVFRRVPILACLLLGKRPAWMAAKSRAATVSS
jgi:fucose 4-O-acetylase-like acetyltransferase